MAVESGLLMLNQLQKLMLITVMVDTDVMDMVDTDTDVDTDMEDTDTIGKRSADAEAEPHYGYYGYPYAYGYYPYGLHHVAKVAPLAKAGVAGHPTGTSFVARSPQGLRGKRSAEQWGYGYPYGFYGHPYAYGPGIAGHPGAATSYVARSPQGLGK